LQTVEQDWFDSGLKARLGEITERTMGHVEEVSAVSERASVIQDEVTRRLSTQMNRAMYMLSLVAAVALPASLIAGLMGMNVGGIPGTESAGGFAVIIAILAILAGAQIWLFRRLKWL